ncbi:MAG: hypothetical protein FWG98_12420 [Candidatus Cloacimonetes bacterium]|nr:hypothetical protein [Candidatus Cloacimonadota bacterium]
MDKVNKYMVIANLCTVFGISILVSWLFRPIHFKGFIGFVTLITGWVFMIVSMVKHEEKSVLFNQNKKRHVLNWVFYILSLLITAVVAAFAFR